MPLSSHASRRTVGALSAALALLVPLTISAAAAQAAPASATVDTNINGYRTVGYYTQWSAAGDGFLVKKLQTSGAADQLTHINYAFANIHPDTLTCFEANQAGGAEGSETAGDYAGDAWADYGRPYTAAESVSGEADAADGVLAGNFNQLLQLKAEHPELKILISMGGWTWSKYFSAAAKTPESRAKLVASCIDLFIKGNLPVIDGKGGEGAAAGLFDGIDIDWEWPGAPDWAQHPGNLVDPENDKANMTALLAEFRTQLDALGEQTGEDYLLSAFLPANSNRIPEGWDVPAIFESLDFANVQGYDLWGSWGAKAGHQSNLYHDDTAPQADAPFSVSQAVQNYLDAGVDPAQLTMGMPMYGQGWTNVAAGETNGVWQAGEALWSGPDGNNLYSSLKKIGTTYYDEALGASWVYDGTQFWSLDDPRVVAQKAKWIAEKKIGGGMFWDLSGDDGDELSATLATTLAASATGPITSPVVTEPTEEPTQEPTTVPAPTPTATDVPIVESYCGFAAGPGISLDPTQAYLGQAVRVTGECFDPGETVEIVMHSQGGVTLTTATVDSEVRQSFVATFSVPADAAVGVHEIVATGLTSGVTASATLTVLESLPVTGSNLVPLLIVAAVLLAAGAVALVVVRRRASQRR